jgi:hypothetical protein
MCKPVEASLKFLVKRDEASRKQCMNTKVSD